MLGMVTSTRFKRLELAMISLGCGNAMVPNKKFVAFHVNSNLAHNASVCPGDAPHP
jgi:hypothetical protein